jgi:hypothetical protein
LEFEWNNIQFSIEELYDNDYQDNYAATRFLRFLSVKAIRFEIDYLAAVNEYY